MIISAPRYQRETWKSDVLKFLKIERRSEGTSGGDCRVRRESLQVSKWQLLGLLLEIMLFVN